MPFHHFAEFLGPTSWQTWESWKTVVCLRASLASFHFFVVVLLILLFLHPLTIFLFLANPGSIFLAFFFLARHSFVQVCRIFFYLPPKQLVSGQIDCVRWLRGLVLKGFEDSFVHDLLAAVFWDSALFWANLLCPFLLTLEKTFLLPIIAHFYTDISGGIRRARKYKGVRCVCAIRRT